MGYELRRAIRDALPPGLTPGERAVLLELADYANEQTRRAWPGMNELRRAVDMTEDGVSKALRRLASRGLEIRVAIGKDKNGRPLFACNGRQTSYLLPTPEEVAKLGPRSGLKAGSPSGLDAPEARTTVPGSPDRGPRKPGPPSGPSPQRTTQEPSSSRPSHLARVAELTETDDDEAQQLINHIKTNTTIRKTIGAYLAGIGKDDLLDHLATMRAQHQQAQAAAEVQADPYEPSTIAEHRDFRRWIRSTSTWCEHGTQGGHAPMPGTGWIACHHERARLNSLTLKEAS